MMRVVLAVIPLPVPGSKGEQRFPSYSTEFGLPVSNKYSQCLIYLLLHHPSVLESLLPLPTLFHLSLPITQQHLTTYILSHHNLSHHVLSSSHPSSVVLSSLVVDTLYHLLDPQHLFIPKKVGIICCIVSPWTYRLILYHSSDTSSSTSNDPSFTRCLT